MNKEKFLYEVTPPGVSKLIKKFRIKKSTPSSEKIKANQSVTEELIKKLRNEKMNLFIADETIDAFCDLMQEQFIGSQPLPTKGVKNQELCDQLQSDGFIVIRIFLDPDLIDKIAESVEMYSQDTILRFNEIKASNPLYCKDDVHENIDGLRFCYDLSSSIIRIHGLHTKIPLIQEILLESNQINDIIKSYLGGKVIGGEAAYADYKAFPGTYDSNLLMHTDDCFKKVKTFLPLYDITDDNAPFVYYKGSHKFNEWRLLKDLLMFSNYNKEYVSSYYYYNTIELEKMANKYRELSSGEQRVSVKKGDLIIADTRGVHGGSILNKGYRLQLGSTYAQLGPYQYCYLPSHVLKYSKRT